MVLRPFSFVGCVILLFRGSFVFFTSVSLFRSRRVWCPLHDNGTSGSSAPLLVLGMGIINIHCDIVLRDYSDVFLCLARVCGPRGSRKVNLRLCKIYRAGRI